MSIFFFFFFKSVKLSEPVENIQPNFQSPTWDVYDL